MFASKARIDASKDLTIDQFLIKWWSDSIVIYSAKSSTSIATTQLVINHFYFVLFSFFDNRPINVLLEKRFPPLPFEYVSAVDDWRVVNKITISSFSSWKSDGYGDIFSE